MNFAEALADFERHFTIHPCEPSAVGPTGLAHVAFNVGTKVRKGQPFTVEDEAKLVDAWFEKAKAYAFGRGWHLFWRERPVLDRSPIGGRGNRGDGVTIYGRFSVGANPPVVQDVAA